MLLNSTHPGLELRLEACLERNSITLNYSKTLEEWKIGRCMKKSEETSRSELENRLAMNIERDPKSFFCYANRKGAGKTLIGPFTSDLGDIIDDDFGMAETLNNFFSSVFLRTGKLTETSYLDDNGTLNTVDFSVDKVVKAIRSLKPTKAPGPDSVYPRFLIEGAKELAGVLSWLFNVSIRSGVILQDWRCANVVPIFKKGDSSDPGNYRPVSLTSVVGKLMEVIIKETLSEYLEVNEILVNYQHGF